MQARSRSHPVVLPSPLPLPHPQAIQFDLLLSQQGVTLLSGGPADGCAPKLDSFKRPGPSSRPGCTATDSPVLVPTPDAAATDFRTAAQRLSFKYAVPYADLLRPEERAVLATGSEEEEESSVWMSGLTDGATGPEVEALLSARGLPPVDVALPDCGGYGQVRFTSLALAAQCVADLDGATNEAGGCYVVMMAQEARVS